MKVKSKYPPTIDPKDAVKSMEAIHDLAQMAAALGCMLQIGFSPMQKEPLIQDKPKQKRKKPTQLTV